MAEVPGILSFGIKYHTYSKPEPDHIYHRFMPLLCLQGALLSPIWPVMKLICGTELVLKEWSCICIKLDLKEKQGTSGSADSVGDMFLGVLPLSALLSFWVLHCSPSALPACVSHPKQGAWILAVR